MTNKTYKRSILLLYQMHPHGIEPCVSETGGLQPPCPPWAKMLMSNVGFEPTRPCGHFLTYTAREIRTLTCQESHSCLSALLE